MKTKGDKSTCCSWRSVRFTLLFLISVGAIVGVYQFRSIPEPDDADDNVSSASARTNLTANNGSVTRRPPAVFDINDVITHDRWVVLQPSLDEDSWSTNELMTCAVVEASVEQGWRPLVVAEHLACCSKPRCVLLHEEKRTRLPYDLRGFLEKMTGSNETKLAAQRNLAFLFAIQHGARFLMDWYLEAPYGETPRSVSDYQRRATQLLQSATLDVSLGLVLERPADAPLFAVSPRPTRRVYNPHAHFGRPDFWAEGFQPPQQRHISLGLLSVPRSRLVPRWATEAPPRRRTAPVDPRPHQRYRVCELRPPSIEKYLHQNVGTDMNLDTSAPAVVIPGDTLAPASAQTSLYSGEALWALALLPSEGGAAQVPSHLLRTLWAYPLLANIAASVKISLSPLPSPQLQQSSYSDAETASREVAAAVLRWRCSSRSILTCVTQLGRDLAPMLGHEAAAFLATWANDLRRLRYLEPPVVPLRRGGLRSPCLGHHGLGGLTFQAMPLESPSPLTREEVDRRTRARGRYSEELQLLDWIRQLDTSHNNDSDTSESPVSEHEPPVITEMPSLDKLIIPYSPTKKDPEKSSIQRETVDGMCLGFSDLLPSRPNRDFTTMLLVVSFNSEGGYDLLPMIEIMYRPHFHNILYCGPPHSSIDIYTHKFQVSENRTLSYLPASTSGFECMVGAMEMGYHVDDYLYVTADSLLLPWTMTNLNRSQLWFGSEVTHDEVITRSQWRNIDPGGQKLPRVVDAVGQALKFIAHLLGVHEPDHDDHDIEDDMMTDDDGHHHATHDEKSTKTSTPAHHEETSVIPELHLHAEGITETNATSVYSYDTKDAEEGTNVTDPPAGTDTEKVEEDIVLLPSNHNPEGEHVEAESKSPSDVYYKDEEFKLPYIEISNSTNVNEREDILPEKFEVQEEIKAPEVLDTSTFNIETHDAPQSDSIRELTTVQPISSSTNSVATQHEIEESEQDKNRHDEKHSTVDTEETSPSVGLQDVASENPSDIEDGIVQYILSSTSSSNVSDIPTSTPDEIPWPVSNETLPESVNIPSNLEDIHKEIHEIHLASTFDQAGESGVIVVDEGVVRDKHVPAYRIDTEVDDKPEEHYNITSFLDIDELTDSSLNPVHDTLSSQHDAEEIEENAENGFAKRKAESETEEVKSISKRDTEEQTPLQSYMDRRMDRTFGYIEELFSSVIARLNSTQDNTNPIVNQHHRLDPREFKHLRCHDTGIPAYHANTDLCQSLKQFFLHLNELYHTDGDFTPPYTSYPVYHIPSSQQRAFYLLANVFLQFGVPEQVAVPLLLRGLAVPHQAVVMRKTYFGSEAPATVQPGYPLFDEKAHFLHPVSLQRELHSDARFRTVFCLKFLYNMLS